MFTVRLLTLYLLWKYIQGEYSGLIDEIKNRTENDDDQSTATALA